MWVITVFEQKSIRMFEFATKVEAKNILWRFPTAVLSYTN